MTEFMNEVERTYRDIVRRADGVFNRIEAERAKLYREDGSARYSAPEMRRREGDLQADPEFEAVMQEFEEARQAIEADLRALIEEEQAQADAVGVNPIDWTWKRTDPQKWAAELQLKRAVLDALGDREAVDLLEKMAVKSDQPEAVSWLLVGRARLKHALNVTTDTPAVVRQIHPEVQRVISSLREKALSEDVEMEIVAAQRRVDALRQRREELLGIMPKAIQEKASRRQAKAIRRSS